MRSYKMKNKFDITTLSRKEKLRMMEALWADLSKDETSMESPAWHEGALSETRARYDAGQEKIMDWQDAKKELRKRFE